MTIKFNPASLFAQSLIQAMRLSKEFEVEETEKYDPEYVKMVRAAEKGNSCRLAIDELWK